MALTSKAPSKSIRPPKRNPAARTRSRVPARRRPPPQKRFSLASPRSLERRGRCPRRFSFSTASRRPPRFLNLTRSISGVSLARKCTERFCHGPVTPVRRLPDLAAVLCLLWRRLVQYRRANASATLPGLCPQSFHHVHLGYARHEQQCGHGLGEPGERFYRLGAGHLDRPACRRKPRAAAFCIPSRSLCWFSLVSPHLCREPPSFVPILFPPWTFPRANGPIAILFTTLRASSCTSLTAL